MLNKEIHSVIRTTICSFLLGSVVSYFIAFAAIKTLEPVHTVEVPVATVDKNTLPTKSGMRLIAHDYPYWKEHRNQVAILARDFGEIAKESGAITAVEQGSQLLGAADIPNMLKEIAAEAIIIAAVSQQSPSSKEVSEIVRLSAAQFLKPCIQAFAFALTSGNCAQRYNGLKEVLDKANVESNSRLSQLMIRSAVLAGDNIGIDSLQELTDGVAQGANRIWALKTITDATVASSLELAVKYVAAISKDDIKLFIGLFSEIGFNKETLTALASNVTSQKLSLFVDNLLAMPRTDLQDVAELSKYVPAVILREDTKNLLTQRLINYSLESTSNWLLQVPENQRAELLSAVIIKLGTPNLNTLHWLEAASQIEGVSEAAYYKAVTHASGALSYNDLAKYFPKLSLTDRENAERTSRLQDFNRLEIENADGMLAYINAQPQPVRDSLYGAAGSSLVRKSLTSALKVSDETQDPKLRTAIETALLSSSISPDDYFRHIERRLKAEPPEKASPELNGYIRKLLVVDASKALSFTLNLPDSPRRDAAVQVMAADWSRKNPETASEWISQMNPSGARDLAIVELTKVTCDEPASAFANIASISSASLRMESAFAVVDWWKGRDQKKIVEYIASSKLSLAEKETLNSRLNK